VAEYLAKMQSLGNDMATTGRPLDDEDLVQYILGGLDEDYDSIVNSIPACAQPILVSELASQMLAFESRVDLRAGGSGTSANFARCGHGDFGCGGAGRGRSGRGGLSSNSGGCGDHMTGGKQGRRGNDNSECPQCQVCLKYGHNAERCWYRYDEGYVPEQRHMDVPVTTSYGVDTNSGATDHIASELDKLAVRDKYTGGEKVHTANGEGMEITHTEKSFIHTPTHTLELSNILRALRATKNLMFIHRFALDNNVFFEIHLWFFLIKDRHKRSTLLKGRCHDGIYPILAPSPVKLIFGVNKPSLNRWHEHLGHPSSSSCLESHYQL
jgi:hypothetical protein